MSGDHVALMINNLGGTSVLEMNIVAHEAIQWLGKALNHLTGSIMPFRVQTLIVCTHFSIVHLLQSSMECLWIGHTWVPT